jgi:hypothetical protein
MAVTSDQVKRRLDASGDTEEVSVSLNLKEWATVGSLIALALAAGCPDKRAVSALVKIGLANVDVIGDEWPESFSQEPR